MTKKLNSKKRENNPASVVIDPSEISPGFQNSSKIALSNLIELCILLLSKNTQIVFKSVSLLNSSYIFVDYVTVRILLGIKVFEGWKAFGRFLMKFTVYL